jgi:GNAT superfamily N-acetyltransferase
MGEVTIETLKGAAIADVVADLAALRIEVFREFPYLYEGTLEYERRYLSAYPASPGSAVVVARVDGGIVGAATAMPALAAEREVRAALEAGGYDLRDGFYFGESVLRRGFRGRGIGHAFFDGRETAAREEGARWAAFCAVDRPADHPARPAEYRPLDAFWSARGYTRRPGITAAFSWPDAGMDHETSKTMVFWTRAL